MVKNEGEKEKFSKGLKLIKKIKNIEEQKSDTMTDDDLDKLLENI
jgi:hypothetical protein